MNGFRCVPAKHFTKGHDAAQVIRDTLFYVNLIRIFDKKVASPRQTVDNSGDNSSERGKLYNKRVKIRWINFAERPEKLRHLCYATVLCHCQPQN
jgi:hypothetical protein